MEVKTYFEIQLKSGGSWSNDLGCSENEFDTYEEAWQGICELALMWQRECVSRDWYDMDDDLRGVTFREYYDDDGDFWDDMRIVERE